MTRELLAVGRRVGAATSGLLVLKGRSRVGRSGGALLLEGRLPVVNELEMALVLDSITIWRGCATTAALVVERRLLVLAERRNEVGVP